MEEIKIAEVVKIFDTNVWIESDFFGSKHVMVQHDGESEPFTYCTFNYDYRYTSNSSIKVQAEKMAISLGANEPVEYKARPFEFSA